MQAVNIPRCVSTKIMYVKVSSRGKNKCISSTYSFNPLLVHVYHHALLHGHELRTFQKTGTGLPWRASGEILHLQCRRCGFDPGWWSRVPNAVRWGQEKKGMCCTCHQCFSGGQGEQTAALMGFTSKWGTWMKSQWLKDVTKGKTEGLK